MKIAGVSVGNLDRQESANRLLEVYSNPVELQYNENIIHLNPAIVGFELNLDSMLAAADLQRLSGTFWTEFWSFLWNSENQPESIPLDATYSEPLLRKYLIDEISIRYDSLPVSAKPLTGQLVYEPGTPGTSLNIESNIFQIENALHSPGYRTVNVSTEKIAAPLPSIENLEILLKQTIDLAEFDGIAGVYLMDLLNGEEVHFILNNGVEVSTYPDLAFTASSTIKIPIMVSAFRHMNGELHPEALNLLTKMITQSGNDPADWLMQQFIDEQFGPREVTKDMKELGLENTFLAGYFYNDAVLLDLYNTPANSRTDVKIGLDIYNQTTLSDMGQLLSDIYMCEQNGGGALIAVFPDQITQDECRMMIDLLTRNKLPTLIEAGPPEGTRIAHKHGWVSDFSGITYTIGDAGIVYTPNHDYVLVFYFYHPVQLIWGPSSELIGDLSKVIYNYFNLSN